jgi:SAM-dependent methyltransferase
MGALNDLERDCLRRFCELMRARLGDGLREVRMFGSATCGASSAAARSAHTSSAIAGWPSRRTSAPATSCGASRATACRCGSSSGEPLPPRVDYERHGRAYAAHRRSDPRIAAHIHAALGDARTVVNVGAGTGSYEPDDRWVLAVEPSATMRAQRPPGAAPGLDARAEDLPFDDGAFDAALACLTVHHWHPVELGLAELRRVARGPVVVFTLDLSAMPAWQREFLADGLRIEEPRFPAPDGIAAALGGRTRIEAIPTPADCADGFIEASWNRPEALLDPAVRGAQSMWTQLPQAPRSALSRDSGRHGPPARGTPSAATFARNTSTPARSGSWCPSSRAMAPHETRRGGA